MTNKEVQRQEATTPEGVERTRQWPTYVPAVDIVETEKGFSLEIDLPGVDPKDVDIRFEKGMLTLTAERTVEEPEGEQIAFEFESCGYERSFTISNDINAEGIQARFSNGVLCLELPKAASAVPRKIEITTA